ncbi:MULTISPECIES: hypothetical protein [unclassified Pseudodesulfovibrio]|uniref:hypothetical protein n=1 Tax=unclassified Pseudodesulfovibrio TaxID=2661612 RepID=UPI000FEB63B2|nr:MULTISPECIES: hypothetical protein [unclassified Pseudodesulfovibrio]MCJ2165643.1 hypothetical protein [Pseudodesulfovibrio sp. S3-i]RWU03050.1 hypothetical protein DWB63_13460 [Pseudodesulfovibrio sp. S3]
MGKRILIGTAEIARNTYNLSLGFRELGHQVDSLVYAKSRLYSGLEYTLSEVDFLDKTTYATNEHGEVVPTPPPSFYTFVEQYDIFIFNSGSSLLPRLVDLPLLKSLGKTVVSRHCGTEVRDYELAKIFWTDFGRFYPYYQKDLETPKISCTIEADLLGLSRYHPALANKMHNVRTSERFADAVFSGPPSHTLGLRPYFQSGPSIDVSHIDCKIPGRKVPVILHAPSSPLYKQTDAIMAMLDELAGNGLRFELKLLQEVPNHVVCKEITEADIVIDELSCGSGLLAFEGMAGGCAVLGGHDGVSSALPRNRPVLNITKDNFKAAVTRVVRDVRFRTQLAELGREYIEQGYSSPPSIAQYIFDALKREKQNKCDYYPTLFTEKGTIPPNEPMPPYLLKRNLEIMLRYGVHPGTDLPRLIREGLLPEEASAQFDHIPRWDVSKLIQEGPWILTHPEARFGSPHPVPVID